MSYTVCAMARHRDLKRSVRLFSTFRLEQSEPSVFYGAIAADSIELITDHHRVPGSIVVDVGAGRQQFADAFALQDAYYVAIDPDVSLLDPTVAASTEPDRAVGHTVLGDGYHLPIADASVDISFSSNVLEHVADPRALVAEMVRVTKPGGIIVVSFTNWLGPWGGHETAPFHFLGGYRAARRYARKHGHPPKNNFGESLFALSVAEGLDIARSMPGTVVLDERPRYHPDWATWVLRVPGLREFVTWNLWFVLRRV